VVTSSGVGVCVVGNVVPGGRLFRPLRCDSTVNYILERWPTHAAGERGKVGSRICSVDGAFWCTAERTLMGEAVVDSMMGHVMKRRRGDVVVNL